MFLTLMWRTNWVLYLAPLAWALWRRDARLLLLAAIFAAQSAYSVYAGGAAREWWGG